MQPPSISHSPESGDLDAALHHQFTEQRRTHTPAAQHIRRPRMEGTLLLLLLLGLLLVLHIKLVNKMYFSAASLSKPGRPPLRLPPGPWQLPVIGSLHHLLVLASRHGGLLHHAVRELSGRHGPVMLLRLGAVPTLVVSSSEAAREVLKTHDAAFASKHQTPMLDVFSNGGPSILFSHQLRRICMLELFSARRVQSFRRIREEEAGRLLRSVADSCAAGHGGCAVVDIGERVCQAMNDIVVRSAVGGRCARRDEFLCQLNRVAVLISGFNLADLYPSSRLVRRLSRTLLEAEQCNRQARDIISEIIRDQLQQTAAGGRDDEEDDNLLAVLLRLQRDGGGDDAQCPLTTDVITTVVQEIFGAGSETSSTTLEWALSELARNPAVMRRAQAEVREAFRGQRRLMESDMARLSYLPLVVKETLRLHVPVPFLLPRKCRETCQVLGYDVPRGTKVLVNAWAIARDPAYWDDPETFRPERFEGSGGSVDFGGTDFEFIPFGAGRRMCPGMALGLVNMELSLAGLLYHFDWTPADGDGRMLDMSEAFGITVRRRSKLVLRATPRVPCSY